MMWAYCNSCLNLSNSLFGVVGFDMVTRLYREISGAAAQSRALFCFTVSRKDKRTPVFGRAPPPLCAWLYYQCHRSHHTREDSHKSAVIYVYEKRLIINRYNVLLKCIFNWRYFIERNLCMWRVLFRWRNKVIGNNKFREWEFIIIIVLAHLPRICRLSCPTLFMHILSYFVIILPNITVIFF